MLKVLFGSIGRSDHSKKNKEKKWSIGQPIGQPPYKPHPTCPRPTNLPLPPVPVPNNAKSKAEDAIKKLPYFHPEITTKEDIKDSMEQYRLQEGYFFLRKSLSEPSSYTISVSHRTGTKHMRIAVLHNGHVALQEMKFRTMDELVQHYSHTDIPTEDKMPGIRLCFPIRRPADDFGEYITPAFHPPAPTSPSESEVRCDCGLLMAESTLPGGWSLHISRDPDTEGRLFYVSPSHECVWNLPHEICDLLTSDNQDLIRRLMFTSEVGRVQWSRQNDFSCKDCKNPTPTLSQLTPISEV